MIVGNFSDYMNKPEPETKKNTSKINTEDLKSFIILKKKIIKIK